MPIPSLIDFLNTSNFVTQPLLETSLYHLKIKDRERLISLKKFDGQLERDSWGIPYWNVYLQTTALITSRSIVRATKNSIGDINAHKVKVNPLDNFQECNRKKLFSIPQSDFFPGHFNRVILKFQELLENEQVKEAIKQTTEKYGILI